MNRYLMLVIFKLLCNIAFMWLCIEFGLSFIGDHVFNYLSLWVFAGSLVLVILLSILSILNKPSNKVYKKTYICRSEKKLNKLKQ